MARTRSRMRSGVAIGATIGSRAMPRWGTYSIVARDPRSGELGVAVQSHWFAVGPIVPWVRAGVGAVATQSITEPAYGPRALDGLAAGAPPPPAPPGPGGPRAAPPVSPGAP